MIRLMRLAYYDLLVSLWQHHCGALYAAADGNPAAMAQYFLAKQKLARLVATADEIRGTFK